MPDTSTISLALDLILVVILVVCIWTGFKKGILMGIIGLLIIIVSIYGGNLLSNTFAYEVTPALKPFASGYMEPKINTQIYTLLGYEPDVNGEYNTGISINDLLAQNPDIVDDVCRESYKAMGIYETTAVELSREAEIYAQENGKDIPESIVQIMCDRIAWYLGFIIAFTIVAIVLTVIVNIPNLSLKIPYIGIVNDIGGLVIGLIEGMILCALFVWAIKFAGILIKPEAVSGGRLVSWFMEKDYLFKYLGI